MKIKRAFAALSVIAAAGAVPVVMASPAQADQLDCMNYLKARHYVVGAGVRSACDVDSIGGKVVCQGKLISLGVRPEHALNACVRA
ncbi:hypothetical protein AB0N92_11125 [Streptomyces sp. NPDC093248]|uniref:hypothetical protein n=1 Tax=Streptomyces sp. NPDC093248 TaxID=3155072 RepID=UPI0034121B4A